MYIDPPIREVRTRGMFTFISEDGRTVSDTCSCGGCFSDTIELQPGDMVISDSGMFWRGHSSRMAIRIYSFLVTGH